MSLTFCWILGSWNVKEIRGLIYGVVIPYEWHHYHSRDTDKCKHWKKRKPKKKKMEVPCFLSKYGYWQLHCLGTSYYKFFSLSTQNHTTDSLGSIQSFIMRAGFCRLSASWTKQLLCFLFLYHAVHCWTIQPRSLKPNQ